MSDDPRLEEQLEEEAYARLCDEVSLHLRLNRLAMAEAAVAKLLERWADRTTAQERAGDVALAQGKVSAARGLYQKALEIEPANADAERKYGLALLTLNPEERRRQLIDAVITDPTAHRATPRKPLNAVLNALVFPGLGQLYNREHDKGLYMVAGGGLLVMLLFYLVVQAPYSQAVTAAGGKHVPTHEQWAAYREALGQMGGGSWFLVIVLGVLYLGLYGYGLYDAWKQAQSEAERDLGVH